jgi:hypothetical protein
MKFDFSPRMQLCDRKIIVQDIGDIGDILLRIHKAELREDAEAAGLITRFMGQLHTFDSYLWRVESSAGSKVYDLPQRVSFSPDKTFTLHVKGKLDQDPSNDFYGFIKIAQEHVISGQKDSITVGPQIGACMGWPDLSFTAELQVGKKKWESAPFDLPISRPLYTVINIPIDSAISEALRKYRVR